MFRDFLQFYVLQIALGPSLSQTRSSQDDFMDTEENAAGRKSHLKAKNASDATKKDVDGKQRRADLSDDSSESLARIRKSRRLMRGTVSASKNARVFTMPTDEAKNIKTTVMKDATYFSGTKRNGATKRNGEALAKRSVLQQGRRKRKNSK